MREQITKIKEYADVADATYAMLHYIEEKEEFDTEDDKWEAKYSKDPPARWIYADGIKRGYEIEKDYKEIHRKQGQPTAYALAIEARFSQEKEITIKNKKREIDNTIQNFIERKEDNPALENQKIKVSTTKEKMIKERTSHYLSYRTKAFTSRYELLHHQKNTSLGYSATLFLDTWAKSEEEKYILAFRGTEVGGLQNIWQDAIRTDGTLAVSSFNILLVLLANSKTKARNLLSKGVLIGVNPQAYSLLDHREIVFEIMRNLTKKEEFKLNIVGHSLGGNVAQQRAS